VELEFLKPDRKPEPKEEFGESKQRSEEAEQSKKQMKWSGMKKCRSRWERTREEEEEEEDEDEQSDLKENGGTRVPHEHIARKENDGTRVLKTRVPRGFFSTSDSTTCNSSLKTLSSILELKF